jgi:TfoX/Sxy family transcriptional regulator of competence genes
VSYDRQTAERVRRLLAGRPGVAEKRMVGGLSFMVDGAMCCGVAGDALMVRVGAEARERALTRPHVRPVEFAGRPLAGFVRVEPAGFRDDAALESWVRQGLEFVAADERAGHVPSERRPRRASR